MPPGALAERLRIELRSEWDRVALPIERRRFTNSALLSATNSVSIGRLWEDSFSRPWPGTPDRAAIRQLVDSFPTEIAALDEAAHRAQQGAFRLFGTDLNLGFPFPWDADFIGGYYWRNAFFKSIEYNNKGRPSDVKVPWEISRLHWLVPVAQRYVIRGDDSDAAFCRRVIEDWIRQNPVGGSVNWACTMECALRILSWTWIGKACHEAPSWQDPAFQSSFLRHLYLHGRFTANHLEISAANGNHYTADVAALTMIGVFFEGAPEAVRWREEGWRALCTEIQAQTTADGVNFEGSVAYHRLVTELFWWPARLRQLRGLSVPDSYLERLGAMGRFIEAYMRFDGSSPAVGDADDGRALPLAVGGIQDHRYLAETVSATLNSDNRIGWEAAWMLGCAPRAASHSMADGPRHFAHAGYAVLRKGPSHIFIDCAPVGYGGRGGHGHNDCLSFEAMLAGIPILLDSGAYTYTRDYRARNEFRSTQSHSTPMVDRQELNRLPSPDLIWTLQDDAHPRDCQVREDRGRQIFEGAHSGYERLPDPVTVRRRITLEHESRRFSVLDQFAGRGNHEITVPFHFAPGWELEIEGNSLKASRSSTILNVSWGSDWTARQIAGWHSPTYGVRQRRPVLMLEANGLLRSLKTDFVLSKVQ